MSLHSQLTMKTIVHGTIAALLGLAAVAASAQRLDSVSVTPANAKPGEAVTITARFDVSGGLNCAARVHFGDGQTQDIKINQDKDANYRLSHSYANAGTYTVKIEPKTALPTMKCLGANQEAKVTVMAPPPPAPPVAAAPAAAPAAPAKAGGPACPAGWTLIAKSVNKKSGAFECSAKSGTAAPADKLACPGKLGYYENTKTGRLGCRP
jgi:hypothetical protein